jgi:hypothetical protein
VIVVHRDPADASELPTPAEKVADLPPARYGETFSVYRVRR